MTGNGLEQRGGVWVHLQCMFCVAVSYILYGFDFQWRIDFIVTCFATFSTSSLKLPKMNINYGVGRGMFA